MNKYKLLSLFFFFLIIINTYPVSRGTVIKSAVDTLYVDDDAPPEWYNETHFKTIMEAVNSSDDGNTIFVYNGTYYEEITINKSISLIGENKYGTIIDGSNIPGEELVNGLSIYVSYVTVNGFTIQNVKDTGVSVGSNHNNISDNIIKNISSFGIILDGNNHMVSNNLIIADGTGIEISADDSIITRNTITDMWDTGIFLDKSHGNTISWNNIEGCSQGIVLFESHSNIIKRNNIAHNSENVFLALSRQNKFYENNFIGGWPCINLRGYSFLNKWRGNYWDNQIIHFLPKIILGRFGILPLPWLNIDWRPAREPYEI